MCTNTVPELSGPSTYITTNQYTTTNLKGYRQDEHHIHENSSSNARDPVYPDKRTSYNPISTTPQPAPRPSSQIDNRINIRDRPIPRPPTPRILPIRLDLPPITQEIRTPSIILDALHRLLKLPCLAIRGKDLREEKVEDSALIATHTHILSAITPTH